MIIYGYGHWCLPSSFNIPHCVPLQTQETREILHFHYTTWPDFGVPESPASFLNFLFKVRESGCLNSDQGPVVVHCSAGIGRSGTFCLVDTCLLLVCTRDFTSAAICINIFQKSSSILSRARTMSAMGMIVNLFIINLTSNRVQGLEL